MIQEENKLTTDIHTTNKVLAFKSIRNGDYLKRDIKTMNFDGKDISINIPEDIAVKCEDLGLEITAEARESGVAYGFREVKHIRSLVSANVIYDRVVNGSARTEANKDDINEVERLGYLFNEQYNELKEPIAELNTDYRKVSHELKQQERMPIEDNRGNKNDSK